MEKLTKVKQLAEELINKHVPHYRFEFTNHKRTLGICRYRSKTIGLSKYHAMYGEDGEVLNTILHEIAHALAGARNGHNYVWKARCRELGAKPLRCSGKPIMEAGHKYEFRCEPCSLVVPRFRKPKYQGKTYGSYRCGRCKAPVTFHTVK